MRVVLFEDRGVKNFYPLLYSRPFMDLFYGTERVFERAKRELGYENEYVFLYRRYLKELFGEKYPIYDGGEAIFLNTRVKEWSKVKDIVRNISPGELYLTREKEWLAFIYSGEVKIDDLLHAFIPVTFSKKIETDVELWHYPWEILHENKEILKREIEKNFPINSERLFIDKNVDVGRNVVLDTSMGPIVIREGVRIMHNSVLLGPLYIGENSLIKPLSYISGSSIGRVCKMGGEVSEVIVQGYSNKQHHGFLGNIYMGEWVNIGSGVDNSNLKNTYSHVRIKLGSEDIDTGLTFLGGVIGDHTKVAIGMRLNTGTVIGFSANLFYDGLPPKFIPSFSWGVNEVFNVEKAIEVAQRMMMRRGVKLEESHKDLFHKIFELSKWERK